MDRGSAADPGRSELEEICRRILESRFSQFKETDIRASFYPYIGLTHKIRRKDSFWMIRISDHCRNAPIVVLEAVAVILGCKVLRRPPPADAVEVYQRFSELPEVRRRVRDRRRKRGRKMMRDPRGRYHSLEENFHDLNQRFFNDQIELDRLGWSPRAGWKRLAHYDPLHQTITVSPVLDSPKVPANVISYILYHEMLHALFEESGHPGRRRHSREFKRAEMAYPGYAKAKDFLRQFCRNRDRYKK
jgi:hypothetical protein